MSTETRYIKQEVRFCGHCKGEFQQGEEYHPECAKMFLQKENIELQKRKEQADISKYGQVLTNHERRMRENPSSVVGYDNLTYNRRLQKEAQEKQQAYYKKLAEREDRVRKLPQLEYQLEYLKKQVLQDKKEAAEELETENAKLKGHN